ncbi:3'-5' exonuclease [Candidatus Uabimicrobium sp. HlEnr_7]|uniref:3'-5' exonuclease n=1 Tax=Candidatus Uabimicrobium helgolandensis TaxID=3095367 RepID=UPI00355823EF
MIWNFFKRVFGFKKTVTLPKNKYDFVAIDFETANNRKTSICSCGIITIKDGQIIEKKHFLIRPKVLEFYKRNTQIHGITKDDVKDQPTFDKIWPEIKTYINNELVVAHNASFDLGVLKAVLDQYHLDYPNIEYLCTVQLARKTIKDSDNHKLNTLAEYFGIDLKHHDALSDAQACALLVCKICEKQNQTIREVVLQNHIKFKKLTSKL